MNPNFSKEMLLDFMQESLEKAKKNIEEDGSTPPLAFVWALKSEVGPFLRGSMLDVDTGEKLTEEDAGDVTNNGVVLVVPCLYDDHAALLQMLKYLAPNEEYRQTLEMLAAVGVAHKIKEPERTVVEQFKKIMGWHEKDIVAGFLRKMCKETEARGIVKIDECWTKEYPKKEGETAEEAHERIPASIENDPERGECLQVLLETPTFRNCVMLGFKRESPDRNDPGYTKITWGEQRTVMDESIESQTMTGRFVNILMPAAKKEAATG